MTTQAQLWAVIWGIMHGKLTDDWMLFRPLLLAVECSVNWQTISVQCTCTSSGSTCINFFSPYIACLAELAFSSSVALLESSLAARRNIKSKCTDSVCHARMTSFMGSRKEGTLQFPTHSRGFPFSAFHNFTSLSVSL